MAEQENAALERYLEDLAKECSERTIDDYRRDLQGFFEYLAGLDVEFDSHPSREQARAYLGRLRYCEGKDKRTIRRTGTIIIAFYHWLDRKGELLPPGIHGAFVQSIHGDSILDLRLPFLFGATPFEEYDARFARDRHHWMMMDEDSKEADAYRSDHKRDWWQPFTEGMASAPSDAALGDLCADIERLIGYMRENPDRRAWRIVYPLDDNLALAASFELREFEDLQGNLDFESETIADWRERREPDG